MTDVSHDHKQQNIKLISPLISVIIPAYNHEKYVSETIHSIWNQTYPNLELIVIDDGSTDNTSKIIESLLEKSPIKMKFIRKKNEGLARTLNQSLQLINGEYFFLLASDDTAKPQAIETLMNGIKNSSMTNIAVAFGDNNYINFESKQVQVNQSRQIAKTEDENKYNTFLDYFFTLRPRLKNKNYFLSYESFIDGNYVPSGILINKSILLDLNGYDENVLLEDFDFYLKVSKKFSILHIPEVLANYRIHNKNSVFINCKNLRLSHLHLLQRERKYCFSNIKLALLWCKTYYRNARSFYNDYKEISFMRSKQNKITHPKK